MPPTTPPKPARPKRHLSERALEANRRNAQQSTGPKTEAGKAKSRLNAGRHHITAQVTILPDEERIAAEKFCAGLAATFNPEGLEEIQLARAIAENYWRLNQARAAITNRMALSFGAHPAHPMAGGHPQIEYALGVADTFDRDANTLRLISLYEQRTMNQLLRMKHELEAMQKAREEKHQAALAEASEIYKMAAAQNQTWNPEAEARINGGFVFSPAFLEQAIARNARLQAARLADPTLFTQRTNRPAGKFPAKSLTFAPRAA